MYKRKDHFYKRAKAEGYHARSAYKLMEIDRRFRILKKGSRVIELGSWPGGWSKVISQAVGPRGSVIGIDLKSPEGAMPDNFHFIRGDAESAELADRLLPHAGNKVDLVLSDMSPRLSGVRVRDIEHSARLAGRVLHLCGIFLRKGGVVVVKLFKGEGVDDVTDQFKRSFARIERAEPAARRKGSSEFYLIAFGFEPPEVDIPD